MKTIVLVSLAAILSGSQMLTPTMPTAEVQDGYKLHVKYKLSGEGKYRSAFAIEPGTDSIFLYIDVDCLTLLK